MPTAVRSHAKINLGLYLGAPRGDGFHSLVTVYQTMEVHEIVTVTAHKAPATTLKITSNDSRVPDDSRNTAWKMVTLALDLLGTTAEVEVHIDKRLPVQGGLGAGSGNAVAALVGLEAELSGASQQSSESAGRQVGLPPGQPSGIIRSLLTQRLPLAAQVGSDVPLFLIGGNVLGEGRRYIRCPTPSQPGAWSSCPRSESPRRRPFATGTRCAPRKV
jgi:4-diphosphocytidyl-2-C-methyl-D-erythritol kinase